MRLSAQNSAHNISVADAIPFASKLARLGFFLGEMHVNEQSSGGEEANYVPLNEVESIIENGQKVCMIAFYNGNWHNIALLKQAFGAGGSVGLAMLGVQLGHTNREEILLNVPGAIKAIDRLIDKA